MATEIDLAAGDLRVVLADLPDADVAAAEIAPVRYDDGERVVGERGARDWCTVRSLSVRRGDERVASLRVRYDLLVGDLDRRHLVIVDDLAVLAVDESLVALGLPDLEVRWWARAADQIPYVSSILALPVGQATLIVAVCELDVSAVDLAGRVRWRSRAFADVLTGPVSFDGEALHIEDWNGWLYRVDVRTGVTTLISGGDAADA